MKITKVKIQNWGPYFQEHEIDISVTPTAPVVVVWGKNGGGKTNFIDAMKWAFSGGDVGMIKAGPYISHKAIEVGQVFETSVTVEFSRSGNDYILTRRLKIDPADLPDFGDPSLLTKLSQMPDKSRIVMGKVGEPNYSPENSKAMMLRFFPPRLVNSYFFDAAALLESFKKMTDETGVYSADMQNSVETAMGFKGFESFIEVLKDIEQDLGLQADKDVADRRKFGALKSELETLLETAKVLQGDLGASKDSMVVDSQALSQIKEQLVGMNHALEEQRERERLDIGEKSLKIQQESLRLKIKESLSGLWAAPISPRIKKEQSELAQQNEERSRWSQEKTLEESKLAGLKGQLTNPLCQTCGREMELNHLEQLNKRIESQQAIVDEILSRNPSSLGFDPSSQSVFSPTLWNPTKEAALISLLSKMDDLSGNIVDRQDARARIRQIDVRLGVTGDTDFIAMANEMVVLEKKLGDSSANVSAAKTRLDAVLNNIGSCQRTIAGLASATDGLPRQRLLKVQKLIRELSFILSELKSHVRSEIEKDSNLILKSLAASGDKKFSLTLAHDYRITTDKVRPNAGFQQQLIFSLFFAIPRVAQAPFPVIVDSPLQHWDEESRANFLKWCTSGVKQLVLVPHDKELKLSEIPEIFGDALANFYRLVHDEVTMTSSIIKA